MSIVLSVLFLALCSLCGYGISRKVGEDSFLGSLGLSLTITPALLVIVTNLLGLVMHSTSVFWVLGILLVLALLFLWKDIVVPPSFLPSLWVLVSFLLLIFIPSWIFFWDSGSDWHSLNYFPPARLMLEGNFPVMDPVNPFVLYSYHYGASLLSAVHSFFTSSTLALSYAFQPFIAVSGIVSFSGALAYTFSKNWRTAWICSALALGGSGLLWLQGGAFLSDLWTVYIEGSSLPEDASPFRFLSPMFYSIRSAPLFALLGHRPIALGAAWSWGTVFCFYRLMKTTNRRKSIGWYILAVCYSAAVAHTLETTLVLLYAVCFLVCLYALRTKNISLLKRMSCFIGGSVLLSVLQGGVLTNTVLMRGDTRPSTFLFHFRGVYEYGKDMMFSVLSIDSVLLLGFPFFLLPFVLLWILRKGHQQKWILLCLWFIAFLHFLIPFVVSYTPRLNELDRVLSLGMSFGSFALGLWLCSVLFSRASLPLRILSAIILFSSLFSTTLHAPVRFFFPSLRVEARADIALPEKTPEEADLYTWVENTTERDDYFFLWRSPGPFSPVEMLRLSKFITHTGRFIVTRGHNSDRELASVSLVEDIESSCSNEALTHFSIRYIAVLYPEQREWFQEQCPSENFVLRYGNADSGVYEFTVQ